VSGGKKGENVHWNFEEFIKALLPLSRPTFLPECWLCTGWLALGCLWLWLSSLIEFRCRKREAMLAFLFHLAVSPRSLVTASALACEEAIFPPVLPPFPPPRKK